MSKMGGFFAVVALTLVACATEHRSKLVVWIVTATARTRAALIAITAQAVGASKRVLDIPAHTRCNSGMACEVSATLR